VVRYLAGEAGIRQFLDIGTGIPTAGNLHQVAQAIAPETRVVYADYDPVVLAHARALLTSSQAGATEQIDADLRDTGTILDRAGKLLDFTQSAAVTLIALPHAIPDSDDPHAIAARLMDAVPSGSYLAVSHLGPEFLSPDTLRETQAMAAAMSSSRLRGAPASRWRASSRARTWWSPVLCGSRNGARCQAPTAPKGRLCGARGAKALMRHESLPYKAGSALRADGLQPHFSFHGGVR
jgi:S-adenosyl methyltransferase